MHTAVASASRDAARYGSVVGGTPPQYVNCSGIRAAAKGVAPIVPLTDANITVAYERAGTPTVTCPVGAVADVGDIEVGDRIVVTVTTRFEPVVPLFPAFDLTSTDRRTIVKQEP